jgi:hypothetical protein
MRAPERMSLWAAVASLVVSLLSSVATAALALHAVDLQREANRVQADAAARDREQLHRRYAAHVIVWERAELVKPTDPLPHRKHYIDNRAAASLATGSLWFERCNADRTCEFGYAPIGTIPACSRLNIDDLDVDVIAVVFMDPNGTRWARTRSMLTEVKPGVRERDIALSNYHPSLDSTERGFMIPPKHSFSVVDPCQVP